MAKEWGIQSTMVGAHSPKRRVAFFAQEFDKVSWAE